MPRRIRHRQPLRRMERVRMRLFAPSNPLAATRLHPRIPHHFHSILLPPNSPSPSPSNRSPNPNPTTHRPSRPIIIIILRFRANQPIRPIPYSLPPLFQSPLPPRLRNPTLQRNRFVPRHPGSLLGHMGPYPSGHFNYRLRLSELCTVEAWGVLGLARRAGAGR